MENNKELLSSNPQEYLLEVNDLKMYFDITTGFFKTTPLKAVDGVSFKIKKGETLGVVGESGCGKTTLGRTIMNLYKASSGEIIYNGLLISSYSDLNRIKKEEQFELGSLKFEKNKRIKNYQKSLNEQLADGAIEQEEVKSKLLKFKEEENEKFLKESNELKSQYEKKYQDKLNEINTEIENILKDKENKISLLTIVDKASDLDAIKVADEKTLELKKAASEKILKAKEERNIEYGKAKEEKINDLSKFKEFKATCKANEKELEDKIKNASGEEKEKLQKELKSLVKENNNDIVVKKEKLIGDYNIRKSIATGKYQKTKQATIDELNKDISEARSQSKYYDYVDKLDEINKEAKFAIKRIKSSSRFRLKEFRRKCTMVFQDPYSSLNPRMTVQDIIAEPLDVNHLYTTKEERRSKVLELMKLVGLSPEQSTRYAHEFSGGQRQRIGIARSLAVNPEFIVCDEPVSALDVSIQAQVINTFQDLQKELGLTYLFIAHDLLVVRHISNRIAVMYLGKIVEIAETNELFNNPLHPYTISLLSAVPMPDPNTARNNKRIVLEGDVPSPLNVPSGCPFRVRCPKATEACKNRVPVLKEISKDHFVSCLLLDDDKNQN